MLFVPPLLLLVWLMGLLSVAVLGGAGWLIWEWYDNWAVGLPADWRLLYAGLAVLVLALCGRWLLVPFLGRKPRTEEEEWRPLPPGTVHRLPRPDGSVLHVEAYGPEDAPTLLFTHGWGLSRAEWWYAQQHFAGRYRLLLWDLPGLGQSDSPDDQVFELGRLAGHLGAVLELAGGRPTILCGHSIGGMITLTFCKLHPERLSSQIAGLVLTHTTPTNPVNTAWGARFLRPLQGPLIRPLCHLTIWLSPLVRVMNALAFLNGLNHLGNHFMQFGGTETRGQLNFTVLSDLRANPAVAARGMLGMMRYDAVNVLPHLTLPTLIFKGDKDKATLPSAGDWMAGTLPAAEEVLLAPAGHLGLLEQHREWLKAVDAFAQRCFGARS
ncbi:alpha/beta hydrolase [Deinococcus irradiatisoli]|uniref:Alpha/beta hydrolase n=1 Tax=Deinococcus irradiatisoli TaxID=2202254 RepID=A0A2Z3JER1_9DEIO|nr:alpha/beta hydrolase [Deinococcus irradiatisoli]AWN23522.1 alpha/beta hydrolase [Deinococcus irradiatisoli]